MRGRPGSGADHHPASDHGARRRPGLGGGSGGSLAAELVATAAGHPRVAFDGVLARAPSGSGIAAQHDYVALTRGTVATAPGAHVLALSLRLAPQGNARWRMTTDITLTGPDGQSQRRQIVTDARLPRGEAFDLLTGRSRTRAEADLARGLSDTLDALLDSAGCQAPSAILARSGDGLEVPIGQRHGLTRGSLGVIEGRDLQPACWKSSRCGASAPCCARWTPA